MISDLKDVSCIHVVNNLDFGGGGSVIFCVDLKNNTLLSSYRDLETNKLRVLFSCTYTAFLKGFNHWLYRSVGWLCRNVSWWAGS